MTDHSLPYLVNCSLMFTEEPLLRRPAAARAAGFSAVEFWWPFATPVPADREVDAFVAAVSEAGVVLGVGTDKRFFPAVAELLRLAKNGELGKVLHLEAHFSNEVAGTFAEWRYSSEESPAGGMTGTGIHMLDALVALAGPVRRVQSLLLSHKPPPDPHDSLSALLEFNSGVSGTLAMVRSTPAYFRLHAFGRNASAEVLGRTELVLRRSGAEPQQLSFPPADSVRANLEAFADAAAGGAPYPISTGDMLDTVAVFEAIAEAVKSDGRVREV